MSNRKLLLADDSITIQKVVNLTFADEGIEVLAVGDGDTAMERFSDFRPDIVLADVNMPGLNGYKICERLRQDDDTANIPIILLVGSFEPFDEDEARRVGANDWITKPFQSIRQLVTKVFGLLEAPTEEPVAEFEAESVGAGYHEEVPASLHTSENDDIDSLYKQSLAETVELPRSFRPEPPVLGDPGMDDDMIEMSYGGPVERSDMREFEFVSPVETSSPEPSPAFESEHVSEETFTEAAQQPARPYPLDNLSDTLPVINFRPVDIDAPLDTSPAYDSPSGHPTEEIIPNASEGIAAEFQNEHSEQHEAAAATKPLSFETSPNVPDINLLELPASGFGVPSDYRSEENIVELDTPTVANGDNLSPEFIEAVARKVIEKISENVIRQIAWQVVPQVADSVIREKKRGESDQ